MEEKRRAEKERRAAEEERRGRLLHRVVPHLATDIAECAWVVERVENEVKFVDGVSQVAEWLERTAKVVDHPARLFDEPREGTRVRSRCEP